MMRLAPISRREFINRMRLLGFDGPYSGGKHEFLLRGEQRLILPNPHQGDISIDLLSRLLRQMAISRVQWEQSAG